MRRYLLYKFKMAFLLFVFLGNIDTSFAQNNIQDSKIKFSIQGSVDIVFDNAIIWLGLIEPYENKGTAFKGIVKNGKFNIEGETYHPTIATLSLIVLDSITKKPLNNFPEAKKIKFFLCEGKNIVQISDSFKDIKADNKCSLAQQKLESLNNEIRAFNLDSLYTKQFKASMVSKEKFQEVTEKINTINLLLKPIYRKYLSENKTPFFSAALLMSSINNVLNYEEIEGFYNSFSLEIKNSTIGRELFRKIELNKNPASSLTGQKMFDIELSNNYEKKIKLSYFNEKYILLDFWASWCAPCRKVNKEIKKMYKKYGNSKIEIISISIDHNKEKWIDAIKKDQLPWPQLLDNIPDDTNGWSGEAFKLYKGISIPMSFFINPGGSIYEVNPQINKLETLYKTIYGF